MKLLLLGATGRTGQWVLNEALQRGYQIQLLVRDESKITPNPLLRVYKGLPNSKRDLMAAADGCTALISTLNISRTSDFPWAPLRTPSTFLSDTIRTILAVAKETTLQRVVVCSAWGVAETRADIPWWFRWTVDLSNIKVAYRDHERQELLLMESGLDWTIVRPVGLTNSAKAQTVKVSYANTPVPSLTISRKTLGTFMVEVLNQEAFIKKIPVVSKG